jgi:Mor family transcriptional regulator
MPTESPPEDIRLDDLPPLLAEITQLIGLGPTVQLAEHWGGVRHYYPRPEFLSADHPLVALLGLEAARALCQYIGGGEVTVPKADKALRAARDRAIRHARGTWSVRQLATRYRLSERRVWEIVSAEEPAGAAEAYGQMRLF